MVIMEPVQNAGGAYIPPAGYFAGVREICDRYGILLCADEVITGFGRPGAWFASERFDIQPDMITSAKGLSSAYASIGALIASDRVMEPFMKPGSMYMHGMTFGGHPVHGRGAQEHRDHEARRDHRARARLEPAFAPPSTRCSSCPSWATCAAPASSMRSSSSRTRRAAKASPTRSASELLRGFLSPELFRRGLMPRRRPRRPRVQISPPLVAGPEEFNVIGSTLEAVLAEAGERDVTYERLGEPGSTPSSSVAATTG